MFGKEKNILIKADGEFIFEDFSMLSCVVKGLMEKNFVEILEEKDGKN